MDDISIDRLVLNVPGLSTEQAGEVAQQVAKAMAAAPGCGTFASLVVELNDQSLCGDVTRLANAIVESLREQIG